LPGSITIEVRRDGVPRSSQCGGGGVGRLDVEVRVGRLSLSLGLRLALRELLLRELLTGAEALVALEGDAQLRFAGPDTLNVGIAPGRARGGGLSTNRCEQCDGSARDQGDEAFPHLTPPIDLTTAVLVARSVTLFEGYTQASYDRPGHINSR